MKETTFVHNLHFDPNYLVRIFKNNFWVRNYEMQRENQSFLDEH